MTKSLAFFSSVTSLHGDFDVFTNHDSSQDALLLRSAANRLDFSFCLRKAEKNSKGKMMMDEVAESRQVHRLVWTICAAVFAVGSATNLPVPLYWTYGTMSGSSDAAVSVAFACYGIGVLPALFFFGAISDRIGRRLTLQSAVFFSLISILTVVLSPNVFGLGLSRILQGVAIGLCGASATAFLAESLQGTQGAVKGAAYVTAMLPLGFGIGGLSTGLCLLSGPTLLPLSYQAFLAAAVLILVGLHQFQNVSLSQQTSVLRLPYYPPGGILYSAAIGAQWCLVGVVLSTIPVELSHHHIPSWGGMTSFLLPIAGLICQQFAKKLSPEHAARIGLVIAPVGCLLVTLGMEADSLWVVLLGAAVSGAAGLGFSFYGGLAGVALVSRDNKARGAAGFFLACYTGLSFAPPVLSILSGDGGVVQGLVGLTAFLVIASLAVEAGFRVGGRPARPLRSNTAMGPE